MKTKTVKLYQERETKGTFYFVSKEEEDQRPVTFYLPKDWLKDGEKAPKKIELTIKEA